jgi:hypothetical protein
LKFADIEMLGSVSFSFWESLSLVSWESNVSGISQQIFTTFIEKNEFIKSSQRSTTMALNATQII